MTDINTYKNVAKCIILILQCTNTWDRININNYTGVDINCLPWQHEDDEPLGELSDKSCGEESRGSKTPGDPWTRMETPQQSDEEECRHSPCSSHPPELPPDQSEISINVSQPIRDENNIVSTNHKLVLTWPSLKRLEDARARNSLSLSSMSSWPPREKRHPSSWLIAVARQWILLEWPWELRII